VEHNKSLIDLTVVGLEYDAEVKAQGILTPCETHYSEVLRLMLLSREPNLLYLDTDCWLVEPPTFSGIGRGRKSNWAMYSGDNPAIFGEMLAEHRKLKRVNEHRDEMSLRIAHANVINAIHKWEIPWYKNQD
jgi:hypothetical protein